MEIKEGLIKLVEGEDELQQERKQLEEGEEQYLDLLETKRQFCVKH